MYEKIKQFLQDFWVAIFSIVICSAFTIYCYGELHSDGTGTEPIGKQLESIGSTQQEITNGLKSSENTARELREEISSTSRRVADIEKDQRDAGEIIGDSKRIIAEIRERNQTK